MIGPLTRNWWAVLLRGCLAILFALVAFFAPGATIAALALLFGVYALVDGVFALTAAIIALRQHHSWWLLLLEGVIGTLVGISTFLAPLTTAFALLMIVAFWAIMTGLLQIVAAIRLRRELEGEWLLAMGGVISVLLGILLLFEPQAGLIAWSWMIGSYAFIYGVTLLTLGWRLRRHRMTQGDAIGEIPPTRPRTVG